MDITKPIKQFDPAGLPTLIGSVPLNDHLDALEWIFTFTPEIPLWPQLPSNPLEGMLNQFIEGFPGVVEDTERTYVTAENPDFEERLLAFFEEYLAVSEDQSLLADSNFKISKKRAAGIYRLYEYAADKKPVAIKGQITGPFTLLTGLSDKNHKLAYYEPTIREILVKGLAMRASWQVNFLKRLNLPVILFIDEPALAGLGSSSFISISLDDIGQDISEVVHGIHQAGGYAGVHVCANTDWDFLLGLNLDIISFDAHGYFDRFITCRDKIHNFLDMGGVIAWGIVPTSEEDKIIKETAESLSELWEEQAQKLVSDNWDLPAILHRTLITPSCGTGSLTPELARRVLELTHNVSRLLRNKYLPTS
jgi:methionine synthase II (cobalamin-independent)